MAANAPSYAGGHAFGGCVATAMAQIMKYHAYPTQGIGSRTYSDPVNRNYYSDIPGSAYGTQSADFGNTVYNWAAMPNAISGSNYEIARLIYHCGVSVDMNFGPEGSSGSTSTASDSLKKYFKYDDSVSFFSKSGYTDATWISMLRADLDAGRPILYSGSGTGGGHAFVCDGYQATNHFHFNWGWGGYLDGYFYLTALTPEGRNYTNDQDAVLNILPAVVPTLTFPYNQGFEAGTVPSEWRVSGEKAAISSTAKHTGSYSLMLGATDDGFYWTNLAVLKINVPENGQLSFWVKRGYSPGPCQWNRQKAYIKSEFGDTVLHTFFDGEYNDSSWQNITLDLTDWKNKVIKLCFELEKSCNFQEWMHIDDIEITGTAAQLPQVFWDVAASSQTVNENAGTATYTVRLNTASSQNITVPFTVSGTAATGTDHNLADGSITVPAGSLSASKTFQITDDSSKESDETVILTLRTPANAVLGTPVNLTVTIRDNDSTTVEADMYEVNNTEAQAFALSPVFSANTATVKTVNATIHSSTDLDYFKITLPAGYNYSLSSRVHDSGASADGKTYTCNVKYSYKTGAWSSVSDTQAPVFSVNDGGTVLFKVEPFTTGATGTYALEITITREEVAGSPVLSVSPSYHNVPANSGRVSFTVTNTGEGTMTWTASASQDWLSVEYNETTLSVSYLYNSGSQRTGIVTITAPGAENSPKTVQIIQAAGAVLSPDSYEPNDQESQPAGLAVNFTDSTATVKTSGANLHQTEDRDYYSISLPEGCDYTVSARVHDSYDSGDGQTYTGDVKFSFRLGSQWYGEYDTAPASGVSVQGGQILLYKVVPRDSIQMGTYALELNFTRTALPVPILSVLPSFQNVPAVKGSARFTVSNAGQGIMTWSARSDNDWITVDYDTQYLYVFCTDNYGAERTGTITVTSAEAGNSSPQTVQIIQAAGSVLGADSYESNNTKASAALLPLNFSGYSGIVKTSGANIHDSTDTDYFKVSLASGADYILLVRLHDSYESADGQTYSVDAEFNYDAGAGWSEYVYDTQAPEIRISGGGTVYFMVQPYFQGETGTYALEISAVQIPSGTTQPFLYVNPLSSDVSYSSVWTKYSVVNAGGGTLEWEAAGSSDWIFVVSRPSENAVYVNCSYNFGAARSGTVTVTATGALNSPQTIEIHQAAGMPVAADSYESNNIQSSAALLPPVFSGDTAVVRAQNATLHTYDDRDWYAVTLPADYDYTVSPRLHDRYSSSDGNTYTCDLAFYYYTPDGIMHYDYDDGYYYYGYDTDAKAFQVPDGGTLYFEVEPWFREAGTYTFEAEIVRTARTVAPVKGDTDGSGTVNLSDAIFALQIAAGIPVSGANLHADVNADGRIGLEDAVYVLRKVAALP